MNCERIIFAGYRIWYSDNGTMALTDGVWVATFSSLQTPGPAGDSAQYFYYELFPHFSGWNCDMLAELAVHEWHGFINHGIFISVTSNLLKSKILLLIQRRTNHSLKGHILYLLISVISFLSSAISASKCLLSCSQGWIVWKKSRSF